MLSGVFSCHHISQQLLLLYNKVQISSLLLSQLVCHSGKEKLSAKTQNKMEIYCCPAKRRNATFSVLKPFIKRVYNLYTYICPLPVYLLVKGCVCFYCHLTLFMRNKLIYRGFKSVRCIQSIIHYPAYILHAPPRCRAVCLDVCGGVYATGT